MSNAGPDISGVLAQCRPREKERARESKMATQQTANCRFEGIASLCKGISIKRSNLRKAKLAFYVPVNIHVSINTGYSSSTQSQYLYPRYSSTILNCDLKLKTGAWGRKLLFQEQIQNGSGFCWILISRQAKYPEVPVHRSHC